MPVRLTIRRVHSLPGNQGAIYSQHGDQVIVEMLGDLITEEGADVLSDLGSRALSENWRRRHRFQLIVGGYADAQPG